MDETAQPNEHQDPNRPEPPEMQRGRGGVKFCLFGVLMAFAALLITIGIVYMGVRNLSSEEGAWAAIDASLDFDERPAGWIDPVGIKIRYTTIYFHDQVDDLRIMFYLGVDPDLVPELMSVEANSKQRTVTGAGTIEVQGRALPYVDYDASEDERNYFGRTIRLSEEDATEGVLVEFLREGSKPRVTNADVIRELAPFHIGPDRTLTRASERADEPGGDGADGAALDGGDAGDAGDADVPDDGDAPDAGDDQ